MPRSKTDPAQRFWNFVLPEPNSGCWLWTGALGRDGYARINILGKSAQAHIWSYRHFVGEVLEGLELDHVCRVRCCVNPGHLESVTHFENMRRSPLHGMHRTYCAQGHEYTKENTYQSKQRHCRTCGQAASRRYKAMKRAKLSCEAVP